MKAGSTSLPAAAAYNIIEAFDEEIKINGKSLTYSDAQIKEGARVPELHIKLTAATAKHTNETITTLQTIKSLQVTDSMRLSGSIPPEYIPNVTKLALLDVSEYVGDSSNRSNAFADTDIGTLIIKRRFTDNVDFKSIQNVFYTYIVGVPSRENFSTAEIFRLCAKAQQLFKQVGWQGNDLSTYVVNAPLVKLDLSYIGEYQVVVDGNKMHVFIEPKTILRLGGMIFEGVEIEELILESTDKNIAALFDGWESVAHELNVHTLRINNMKATRFDHSICLILKSVNLLSKIEIYINGEKELC